MKYFVIFLILIGFAGLTTPYAFANTPSIHPDDFKKCLDGEFLQYEWCTNYISLQSPLKQFQSGIPFNEIQCKDDLILIQKYDGTPACVTEKTAIKLTARENWTYQSISFTYDDKSSEQSVNAFSDGVTEIINPKRGQLTYYTTLQVIDDKYLGKTVEEWQKVSRHELELQNEAVPDHKFYENLGKFLIKNEMIYQMHMLGIENIDDDFRVLSGSSLDSLPPYIGFSSVVNATDGHYYLLSGGTHANQVNYYKTTQLQYPDESKFPKIKTTPNLSDAGKIPRITISEVGGNDLKAEPYSVILSHSGDVEFYNETPETLTVYLNEEGVEEFSFDTSQEISTRSNSGIAFPFSGAGVYRFHAQVPKNIDGKEYELNTGGAITVLADDMSNLPMPVKMEMAKEILISSDIPISSVGQQGTDDVISIRLNIAIERMLPESKSYYLTAAQNLIPFDIKIALR